MTNTVLLQEVIEKSGLKKNYIAEKMGITVQSLIIKCKGETQFKQGEILSIAKILKLSMTDVKRIFFADEVDKLSTEEQT